jgi:hypothetical protein
MSFNATVLQVLIASPSDVSSRRNDIEEKIFEWNKLYAEDMGVVLLPRRWEDVAPAYSSEDPQQIINKDIVEKCDILVGVFWTKLGTPTARHASGTLEEINICIESGKEILLYFLNDNLPLSMFNTLEAQEEYQKLLEYKRSYGQKGLYAENPEQLVQHLYQKVRNYKQRESLGIEESNTPGQDEEVRTQQLARIPIRNLNESYENNLEALISRDELTDVEILLLGYILYSNNREFGVRWMAEQTVSNIQQWENIRGITSYLSSEYETAATNLADREVLEATEYTGPGNDRKYKLPIEALNELRRLPKEAKSKIDEVISGYRR